MAGKVICRKVGHDSMNLSAISKQLFPEFNSMFGKLSSRFIFSKGSMKNVSRHSNLANTLMSLSGSHRGLCQVELIFVWHFLQLHIRKNTHIECADSLAIIKRLEPGKTLGNNPYDINWCPPAAIPWHGGWTLSDKAKFNQCLR